MTYREAMAKLWRELGFTGDINQRLEEAKRHFPGAVDFLDKTIPPGTEDQFMEGLRRAPPISAAELGKTQFTKDLRRNN